MADQKDNSLKTADNSHSACEALNFAQTLNNQMEQPSKYSKIF